jgi:two-component system, response regulator
MKLEERDILLVEDNPDDAELTVLALRENGVHNPVVHAKNGAEALDYLFATGSYAGRDTSGLPVVVLLDLNLPKLGGIEVLRRIRQHPSTQLLPVIVLTSSREERDLVESYRLGANSYVRKPVDFEAFHRAARQLSCYWLMLNEPPPSEGAAPA